MNSNDSDEEIYAELEFQQDLRYQIQSSRPAREPP